MRAFEHFERIARASTISNPYTRPPRIPVNYPRCVVRLFCFVSDIAPLRPLQYVFACICVYLRVFARICAYLHVFHVFHVLHGDVLYFIY